MKLKTKELVEMLEHFGYTRVQVEGRHNFYFNEAHKSRVLFAPLRTNSEVPFLTLSSITHSIVYSGCATKRQVDGYLEKIHKDPIVRTMAKKRRAKHKKAAKKKKK